MKLAACVVLLSGSALATTIPSIPFADGSGAAFGTFMYNPATNQVTSWDLLTTFTGSSMTDVYNSADTAAAPTVTVLSNFSGNEVLSFEENHIAQRDEFDIVIACSGVMNCLTTATTGSSFHITAGGTEPCGPPGTLCIQSGEQFGVPEVFNSRLLAAGFITDPRRVDPIFLKYTLTSSLSTVTPEPRYEWLLLAALGGLGILRRIHRPGEP
jgi:hypothetical protein